MRLADIAKELRITTQELRKELQKTNFGISSSAHEVNDALGQGVIRFLKGKVKPTLTHRRVAVIFKDGEEENAPDDTKKQKDIKKKPQKSIPDKSTKEPAKEQEDQKDKEETPEKQKEITKGDNRAKVPKSAPAANKKDNVNLPVSRRIEIGASTNKATTKNLPHTYYKSKKKKKRKGDVKRREMGTVLRHPRIDHKTKKVSYAVDSEVGGLSAEEIAIERELDQERFRAQKKSRTNRQYTAKGQPQIKPKIGTVEIPDLISVKEFAEKCGLPVADVIGTLLKNSIIATLNQKLDFDTAAIVAAELGVEVKKQISEATSEELFEGDLRKLLHEEDKKQLKVRPPIVSIMGHVDHGKTKLLDYIRNTNVVAGESGGITQHIGAYQVEKNGHLITFLDTPGHEAFTAMRARGAKATDIAILVVAADEGVKPQTIEAINHAKEAKIPIIVAINKIDKANANIDKVKGELVERGLQPEDWGGKVIMSPVSAITGEGIDELLEVILLVAEMEQLKANPKRLAVGTVIESHLDKALGPVATILINAGTLKVGDSVVVGITVGRIKAMCDYTGGTLKEVPPSAAVRISGLAKVPQAGDILQAYKNKKIAIERAEEMQELMSQRSKEMSGSMVERIVSQINTGKINFLKIVLKADTKGSLEAIMQALQKVKSEDVAIKVIHFGVGNITDTDVIMAAASQALLVGFHVKSSMHVKKLAEKEHVDIKNYTIIYKLIEESKEILSGMLEPIINIIELGKVEIKEIFLNKKKWVIAGCKVVEGKVQSSAILRLKRDDELIFETPIESLKHVKEDIKELEKGSECGIKLSTPKPVQIGDVLEAFRIEKIKQELE